MLAKRAGVTLRPRDPQAASESGAAKDVLRWVSRYWQEVLQKSVEAEEARAYVQQRGLDQHTLDLFGIGYAPSGWDATYQALRKKGFLDADILRAGLVLQSEKRPGYFDRFRGRLMFPIADAHGDVVGFTGRILKDQVGKNGVPLAKYVNSPQTVVYNKSAILYGFDKARAAIKKTGIAVIVEGNMDCITSHQFGIEHVIAVSGTALTAEQIGILKKVAKKLVFAFDQDAAGAQAILRGLDHALQSGLDLGILTLPFGKDPDELIRKDKAAWEKAIATAKPVMEYFFATLTADKDLLNVNDKKQLVRELLPILGKSGDPVEQSHYLEKLADLVHVPVEELRSHVPTGKIVSPTAQRSAPVTPTPAPKALEADRFGMVSERVLALLVAHPSLMAQAIDALPVEAIPDHALQALYKSFVVWYTQNHFVDRHQVDGLVAEGASEFSEKYALLGLLADKEFSTPVTPELAQELLSMISTLKRQSLSRKLRQLEADIRRLEHQGASASHDLTALLQEVRTVTEQLRSLN
jgi:DNA primase